ncbi:hypothetical protein [Prevotella pallens]|uniref:hypothetical protein n=1 Tax=Prevotella pallens TaxID=60133 RepID=UPI002889015E|nr:hypothetical protein [Prevotella pallens]
MKRIHVFNNVEIRFGYGNTHFWLCKNTGTMNRSPYTCGMFTTNSRNVRCSIPIRATHYYNICNASSQTVHNIIITRPQLIS